MQKLSARLASGSQKAAALLLARGLAEGTGSHGGIPAWKPGPSRGRERSHSRRGRRLAAAALLLVVLALAFRAAGSRLRQWRMSKVQQRFEAERQAKPVPEAGLVGTYYRTQIRDGPQPAHSSLWDAACAEPGGASTQKAQMQRQMKVLVGSHTYWRRDDIEPAARCRSVANSGTQLPLLKSIAVLRSAKPRPEGAVTIATQLSLERLPMLQQQCRAWPHPLAAAVYIPLLHGRVASADNERLNGTTLDAALVPLLRLHAEMEAAQDEACILDLEVVTEGHCSMDSATLYPANAARNRALRLVLTEAVVLLDVDFVVSASLAARMSDAHYRTTALQLLQQPVALVLPAFEAVGGSRAEQAKIALQVARSGKAALLGQAETGRIVPFHSGHYSAGHQATDFGRWVDATKVYTIKYKDGFEPYILLHRKHVPWYDERLRGYFSNKVIHLQHLASLGIRWAVHPGGFVIHMPHKTARMRNLTSTLGVKDINEHLLAVARRQMRIGTYEPVVADPQWCYLSDLWDSMV